MGSFGPAIYGAQIVSLEGSRPNGLYEVFDREEEGAM